MLPFNSNKFSRSVHVVCIVLLLHSPLEWTVFFVPSNCLYSSDDRSSAYQTICKLLSTESTVLFVYSDIIRAVDQSQSDVNVICLVNCTRLSTLLVQLRSWWCHVWRRTNHIVHILTILLDRIAEMECVLSRSKEEILYRKFLFHLTTGHCIAVDNLLVAFAMCMNIL